MEKHLDVTIIMLEHVFFMRMCIWLQNKQFLLLKVRAMFLYLFIQKILLRILSLFHFCYPDSLSWL